MIRAARTSPKPPEPDPSITHTDYILIRNKNLRPFVFLRLHIFITLYYFSYIYLDWTHQGVKEMHSPMTLGKLAGSKKTKHRLKDVEKIKCYE